MKALFLKITCFSVLLCQLVDATSYENWMSDLSSYIAHKPLNEVALPGTHDSGTNLITAQSKVADTPDFPSWINALRYVGIGYMITGVVAKWLKTQDQTILRQLKDGNRYLDLRITHHKNNYYTVHALYGENMDGVFQQIKEFIDTHPKEIVILDINHLYNMDGDGEGNEDYHEGLVDKIQKTFLEKLAPNQLAPDTKVEDFWDQGHQVIVLYDDKKWVKKTNFLWSQETITSKWPDTADLHELKDDLDQNLKKKDPEDQKFFVQQCVLTPDCPTIKQGLIPFSRAPKSLKSLSTSVTENVLSWLTEWQKRSYGLNIVLLDFLDDPHVVEAIVDLNKS